MYLQIDDICPKCGQLRQISANCAHNLGHSLAYLTEAGQSQANFRQLRQTRSTSTKPNRVATKRLIAPGPVRSIYILCGNRHLIAPSATLPLDPRTPNRRMGQWIRTPCDASTDGPLLALKFSMARLCAHRAL